MSFDETNPSQDDTPPDLDALFDEEVNLQQADEIIQRSLPPVGTYLTNPEEYPITVYNNIREEKDGDGKVTGKRRVATVVGLGQMLRLGETHTCRLRYDISPDARKAREYTPDGEWTGEYKEKEDITSRLWAQAVRAYSEVCKDTPKRQQDVLEFLKTTPMGHRIMHTDEGDVRVVALTVRRRR